MTEEEVRRAYRAACHAEIEALKPGNVHRFAGGHDMTADDFIASADVSAPAIADRTLSCGERVLAAVEATRAAVGVNTNLGILLLCAPLACAAERPERPLRAAVEQTLSKLTMADARAVFSAIAQARPGGLGSVPDNDVRREPETGLVEAMRQAMHRDRVAYQYASDFSDIFDKGLPTLDVKAVQGGMWPTTDTYLAFLSSFPDSHVARKYGNAAAEALREDAERIRERLATLVDTEDRIALLLPFDSPLQLRDFNPGPSADLTVASLFARNLRDGLPIRSIDG